MKRTIRVFSLLLAAVMLLSAQALATEPAQAVTDVEHSGQCLCGLPRVEPAPGVYRRIETGLFL